MAVVIDTAPIAPPDAAFAFASDAAAVHATQPATEAELIERARTAFRRRDLDAAAAATAEHARLYPRGQLAEESDLLEIELDRARGRTTEMKARIDRFHAAYLESAHRAAIDALETP